MIYVLAVAERSSRIVTDVACNKNNERRCVKDIAFFIIFALYKVKLMKRNLFLVCLWSVFLFVTACSSLQPISYERLQPAEVSFPRQIQKVGVVNNMPAVHQDYKLVDYTSASLEGDGEVAVEALAQEVVAVNYFDQVVVYDKKFRKSVYPLEQTIPMETVGELIDMLNVDMLLAMERVNVELKKSTMFIPELYATVPAVDGIVTSVVRAYFNQREEPWFTVQKTDTICWEITPKLTYGDVVKDVSEYAASMLIQNILPYWKEVERYYFDGGNVDMRDAGVYVREQNWEEASALWQRVYNVNKGKKKMRAAFNLALYYELESDFAKAKEYLIEAASLAGEGSWEAQLIGFYMLQLEEQDKRNRLLELQMKRFEP